MVMIESRRPTPGPQRWSPHAAQQLHDHIITANTLDRKARAGRIQDDAMAHGQESPAVSLLVDQSPGTIRDSTAAWANDPRQAGRTTRDRGVRGVQRGNFSILQLTVEVKAGLSWNRGSEQDEAA